VANLSGAAAEVWACVVCYRTTAEQLRQLLALLEPQVACVVVVDNSPDESLATNVASPSIYRHMGRNAGTAAAMNEAWRLALAAGAAYVVSFDQDSRPAPSMVRCLREAFDQPSPSTLPLAAVGPVWTDERSGRAMRVLAPVRFLRHHVSAPDTGLVEVNHLITSGCLVSAAAYRAVGPFDEDLFLDYVDIEWSLRARTRGYTSAVAANCRMSHALGESMMPIAGRQIAVHRPERTYLQVRNHLLLWRSSAMPRLWLLSDLIQVTGKLLALLVLVPRRAQRLHCIGRGLADGLSGKVGPPPAK
jgi:rhamnosyltransferase